MDNQILEVLDHPGLQQYDGEIKDYIHNQIDSVETLGIQYNEEESALEFVGEHPKSEVEGKVNYTNLLLSPYDYKLYTKFTEDEHILLTLKEALELFEKFKTGHIINGYWNEEGEDIDRVISLGTSVHRDVVHFRFIDQNGDVNVISVN